MTSSMMVATTFKTPLLLKIYSILPEKKVELNYEVIFRNDATGFFHRITAIKFDDDIVIVVVS